MKLCFGKYGLIVSLVITGFIGCTSRNYLLINNLSDYLRYSPDKTPLISAHRGGGSYAGYPENCLESFGHLARQMPLIIECDISTTKDSVLIMMHDDTFERTTNGTGKVTDQPWIYAQNLRLEDHRGTLTNYKIPTLDEVLKWGNGKVIYTLDVKRNVPYQWVVEAVQKAGAQNYAAIITYSVTQAELVHRLDRSLMISVTIRNQEEYERLQKAGIPDNRMIAFVGTREPSAELYEFLHQKKIRTILGTLGNLDKMAEARGEDTYRKFVDNGADILSTDRPLEAGRALGLIR
ncbi:glycerophosphodiester phosphodiesterase family protein [Arundinibacter roseus]|uniref:Glycerophosphodiester phosphodiesterase family protein n=1 Tax=Arundinibacter roseus TaxID=2070510 RepID=A0A4R4K5R1_9BACT|nr:glycerophosphodiester phosphodiesterase family protein [Arundinibacter roseus]TDB61821.1 glycerophosphodiester phosphodiesterase family protein [Arundinibacter roseus]